MKALPLVPIALALTLFAGPGFAVAADSTRSPATGPGASMGPGMMMGSGMMGSGGPMMQCPMMGGGMSAGMGRGMMPVLPPGNEKLQLQMQAEIMQKVGEIIAKYANQIQSR